MIDWSRAVSGKSNNSTGSRIRKIRKEAGLRQREMAKLLGTSQSAVYKHEKGVIPEPRRLLKLAKIGDTTVEWILTGRHWENGSTDKKRLDTDLLSLAKALKNLEDDKRKIYRDAIGILEEAMAALEKKLNMKVEEADPAKIAEAIKGLPQDVLEVLAASSEIHKAIQKKVFSTQKSLLAKIKPD
jgi:transcriptional regulator with XRE-family HTH domain